MTQPEWSERYCGVCLRCNGWGIHGDEYATHTCKHCDGTGKVPRMSESWRPADPEKKCALPRREDRTRTMIVMLARDFGACVLLAILAIGAAYLALTKQLDVGAV